MSKKFFAVQFKEYGQIYYAPRGKQKVMEGMFPPEPECLFSTRESAEKRLDYLRRESSLKELQIVEV